MIRASHRFLHCRRPDHAARARESCNFSQAEESASRALRRPRRYFYDERPREFGKLMTSCAILIASSHLKPHFSARAHHSN
jgi:hypothetical protein